VGLNKMAKYFMIFPKMLTFSQFGVGLEQKISQLVVLFIQKKYCHN
jgi:hypothetical protein